jgi:hypothetical protein
MPDAGSSLSLLRVVESQDLVADQKVSVVRTLSDHIHAELLDEKATRLVPVPDLDVQMVETDETEITRRRSGRHEDVSR